MLCFFLFFVNSQKKAVWFQRHKATVGDSPILEGKAFLSCLLALIPVCALARSLRPSLPRYEMKIGNTPPEAIFFFVVVVALFIADRAQEIEKLTGTEADDGEEDISMMVLPDYSSGNNERDIHVKNFNINVGGLELLDCADLKLAYGRKV